MRDKLFDTVKGIAVYLVVMGHLLSRQGIWMSAFIEACHMPVFFFVSGWFFTDSYKKYDAHAFLQKKTAALFIPYICWSSVSMLTNGILFLLKKDFAGLQAELADIYIYARSVWFLIVLFITNIICLLIWKCADRLSCSPYTLSVPAWILGAIFIQGGGMEKCCGYISFFGFSHIFY